MKTAALWLSILWLAMLPGCTTTTLFSKFAHKSHPKATAADPAVRCLCLWEPAEGTGVDNKPARGVSGKIFFFTRSGASSVEIDGDVRIFLFDDQGSAEEQAQPLHQFEFLGGSWKKYLTDTQFGPAYQLFVPYPRKGRHLAELALRVRLTPPSGTEVFSDIAKIALTGYDRSKAKDEDESLKPDSDQSLSGGVGNSAVQEKAIPQQIDQSMRKILAERNSLAAGDRPRESRRAAQSVAFDDTDAPSVRVRLRKAARSRDQDAGEEEN